MSKIAVAVDDGFAKAPRGADHDRREVAMIKTLVFGFIFFLLATFPATWLLMLFAGNVGLELSYWGTLPLGILVSALLAGVSSPAVTVAKV